MNKEIFALGKHTLVYATGIVISRAISFIMLPIYTSYLTPSDYGTMELLSMTIDIIAMIAGLGITRTVFKYYYEYDKTNDQEEVISSAIILTFIVSLIAASLGILLSKEISDMVFGNIDNAFYFNISFVIYFLQSVNIIPFMLIRALQKSKFFVLINLVRLLIQVALNIIFLIRLNMGISGVLYSTLIAEILIASFMYSYTFRMVSFNFSLSKSRQMVKFGYPFIFASLGGFIITFSDRYFLNVYSDLSIVGIYSLAYKFGFLMGYLAVGPFMQVWEPKRFEIVKQDDALPIFKKVFLYFDIIVFSLSLLICLFVKDILRIMSDPAFFDAYKVVPIIIIAYIFQAWTLYCNFGIYHAGRSKYIAWAYTISAISVLLLNFMLIPRYGAHGAAWATVGAFFIRFILAHLYAQRLYRIDYGWNKHIMLFISSGLIYFISISIETPQITISLGKNSVLMLLFGILIYLFFLDNYEKSVIKRFIKNPISMARTAQ